MAAHTAREEEEEEEEGDPRVPAGSGRGGPSCMGRGRLPIPLRGYGEGTEPEPLQPPRTWGFPWDFHGGFSVLHFLFDLGQGHQILEGKNKIIIKNHFFKKLKTLNKFGSGHLGRNLRGSSARVVYAGSVLLEGFEFALTAQISPVGLPRSASLAGRGRGGRYVEIMKNKSRCQQENNKYAGGGSWGESNGEEFRV